MKSLNNKVALVTSATRGIGLACALKLAQNGAKVYMGARRLDAAQEICDNHADEGLIMAPVFFDAFNKDSYKIMVDEVIEKEGKIDILVNNYGTGDPEKDLDLINTDEDAFFRLLDLNLGSVFRITKLVVPHMIKNNRGGSIVNISSISGTVPDISRIGYGVSKASVNNITQQIAMQYAKYNIRCNAVLPGMTATDSVKESLNDEFKKSFLSHIPLNRMGTPEDIANAVYFFASDKSA
ncbi:MAG: SDR family oxidoreductase, partial [Clostridiales bacterium]|nr:SDR family oxidoreductase [Clostridiales bacterium]